MATSGPFSPNPIPPVSNDIIQSQRSQAAQAANQLAIIQEASEEDFQEWADQFAVNVLARRAETLLKKTERKDQEEAKKKEELQEDDVTKILNVQEIADEFEKKNEEIKARSLIVLKERILESDTVDDILNKVFDSYPDPTLADEALDFLSQTASSPELKQKIDAAREQLHKRFEREVKAGKNILEQSRQFSKEGLGDPSALRNMYRDITGNPREPLALYNELSAKYPFEKMKTVIAFLLHSLGNDMKSKGPSIDKGELFRLLTETRSLQAILGVYRFFYLRMRFILKEFERHHLPFHQNIHYEKLSKAFMKYVQDRYPSSEKIFLMGREFGIEDELVSQEILYTAMLDALRHVSPKLFRSSQHKQDVIISYLEALDEIEEKLENEEEETP